MQTRDDQTIRWFERFNSFQLRKSPGEQIAFLQFHVFGLGSSKFPLWPRMACPCCFGSTLPADSRASIETRQLGELSLALVGGQNDGPILYYFWYDACLLCNVYTFYPFFLRCYIFYILKFCIFTGLPLLDVFQKHVWCDERGQNKIHCHKFLRVSFCWGLFENWIWFWWMGRRRS